MGDSKEPSETSEHTAASPGDHSDTNSMSILTALNLRPPAQLKSTARSQGQSLLKNSPSATTAVSILSSTASLATTSTNSTNSNDETRRTLWKCKRCNFRDSNKETVLSHVKSHYDTTENAGTHNDKVRTRKQRKVPLFKGSVAFSLGIFRFVRFRFRNENLSSLQWNVAIVNIIA